MVVPWLLLRFFVEDLLAHCATGVCCAGVRLEVKRMKRFEEPDHKAWLLPGLTPPAHSLLLDF